MDQLILGYWKMVAPIFIPGVLIVILIGAFGYIFNLVRKALQQIK